PSKGCSGATQDGITSTASGIDGPLMLTKWQYDGNWTQFPDPANPAHNVPWFYIGFLWDLPGGFCFNPGLAGMGYMDYGEPLNTIDPIQYTNGDWATLACFDTTFHLGPSGPIVNANIHIGMNNAVILL